MPNLYASLNDLKGRLGIADTASDAVLLSILDAISREIERWTGHRYYVETRTRYFAAQYGPTAVGALYAGEVRNAGALYLESDLLSVTTLKTDPNGDRTYTDTWATTDYDLLPSNNLYESPPQPYWAIARRPFGNFYFPYWPLGVQIVGSWGYYQVLARSSATVSGAHNASVTTLAVSDGTQFSAGHTPLIGTEQLYVSAVSSNNLTVVRGVNGTTAASHSNLDPIDVYTYPQVGEAALLQASRIYARKDSPLGVIGAAELGTVQVAAFGFTKIANSLDPDVKAMLQPDRRRVIA